MPGKIKRGKVNIERSDAQVPQRVAHTVQAKQIVFRTKKVFLGYEEGDNPELEPTFANHFEVFVLGTDLFLDIGIVKPEELSAVASAAGEVKPENAVEMPFFVTYRVAMSWDTFYKLHAKINEIHSAFQLIKDAKTSDTTH